MDASHFQDKDLLQALDELYASGEYPRTKDEARHDFNSLVDELVWLKESDREDYYRAIETYWRKSDDHINTKTV